MAGGRPSEYKEDYCEQVFKLCLLGAIDKELADFFDISESTLNNWKSEHPEFLESIKKGKLKADAEVAESLFKRAVGFEYDEVTFEKIDSKVNLEVTSAGDLKVDDTYKKKVVTKIIVGDVAAQNIWLKNRRGRNKVSPEGQQWADKQETGFTDANGNDLQGVPVIFK